MLRYKTRFILVIFLSFLSSAILAQDCILEGIIRDGENNETLIGVNVYITSLNKGTVTDIDGHYELILPAGTHIVEYSYVGFQNITKEVTLTSGTKQTLDIVFNQRKTDLDIVVVSGSQYEKPIAEETVSIDVIKSYLVENNNVQDLSEAVEKVPGVNVVDGQATIRGGSGYAYGSGTRVQVLVDDMPLVTGDFGEVKWDFIPMENAENIEIIKGPASVLYGSSALNGVINVRTGYAKTKPETELALYQGIYANPKNKVHRWWTMRDQPNYSGMFFSHRRKIGQIDMVFGANARFLESYYQEGDEHQLRLSLKTRYIHPNNERLKFGVNANAMMQDYGRVFIWKHADTAAYKSLTGLALDKYSYFNVDPYIQYTSKNNLRHKVQTRFYQVIRKTKDGRPTTVGNTVYGEYQLQKKFDFGMVGTAGLVGNFFWGWSGIYREGQDAEQYDNGAKIATYGTAAYIQVEQKIDRLSLVGGLRYEYNAIDYVEAIEDGEPDEEFADSIKNIRIPIVGRLGLNYKLSPQTFLRASWGQGYRSPSLVERYIEEDLEEILFVCPNPNIKPEFGWNAEIGVKRGLRVNQWQGYLDVALFWLELRNMTEFNPVYIASRPCFQTQSIEAARIAGFEVSSTGEGNIGQVPFRLLAGYTYNYPADLVNDTTQKEVKNYLQGFFKNIGPLDSTFNASILKYRFRHTARLDAEIDIKRFTLGTNITYNSPMDRIDPVFLNLIPGLQSYLDRQKGGMWAWDARLAYQANEYTRLTLLAKNLLNREYAIRPGIMEAPMNIALQCKLNF